MSDTTHTRRGHRAVTAGCLKVRSGVFQREMAGAHVLGRHERGSVAFPDDPAAVQDREAVGNSGADGQALFNEQRAWRSSRQSHAVAHPGRRDADCERGTT